MALKENFQNFLKVLRELPEHQKKIILWAIVAALAIIMGIFWIRQATNNLNKIGESIGQIEFPEMDTKLINSQNIEDNE